MGDRVSPALVATVLRHPEGSTRGAPARARVVALLNQADDESRFNAGCEVARELIEHGAERVVIAALRETMPIRKVITGSTNLREIPGHIIPEAMPIQEMIPGSAEDGAANPAGDMVCGGDSRKRSTVSAIVLAAGEGRRMAVLDGAPARQRQTRQGPRAQVGLAAWWKKHLAPSGRRRSGVASG